MIGNYTEVYCPEVEIVEYSISKKYWSNFWLELEYSRRVLASTRVLAAALGVNFKRMSDRAEPSVGLLMSSPSVHMICGHPSCCQASVSGANSKLRLTMG